MRELSEPASFSFWFVFSQQKERNLAMTPFTIVKQNEEKVLACQLAQKLQTLSRLLQDSQQVEQSLPDVHQCVRTVGPDMGVKAAGGARSYADAVAFVEAGATRGIGDIFCVAILKGELADGDYWS